VESFYHLVFVLVMGIKYDDYIALWSLTYLLNENEVFKSFCFFQNPLQKLFCFYLQ